MQLKRGNMWESLNTVNAVFLVTTNSMIDTYGNLIMGGGVALQAKKMFPELPKIFGKAVVELDKVLDVYGILIQENTFTPTLNQNKVCAFQTKINPWFDSMLDVIDTSVCMLISLAKTHQDVVFHLPYPGIGLGSLKKSNVFPIIEKLPDNVIVWEL